MRPPSALAAALLLLAAAVTPAGQAEEYQKLVLKVGTTRTIGGFGGICDDLAIATITQDASATIRALKPGTTLCSSRVGGPGGGIRKAYRVVVVAELPTTEP
jgi:hypothetical protein